MAAPSHVGPVGHDEQEVDDGHEDDEVDDRADECAEVDPLPVDGPAEALPGRAATRDCVDQRGDDVVGEGLINLLKARATTRPTAMTIKSPCIRKFLNPLSMPFSIPEGAASALPAGPASSLVRPVSGGPGPPDGRADCASSTSRAATTASRPSARAAKNTMTTPSPVKKRSPRLPAGAYRRPGNRSAGIPTRPTACSLSGQ